MIPSDSRTRHIPMCVRIMRKAFDWKCSRFYRMLEIEDVPQSCIPYVQVGLSIISCMRSYLLVGRFDLSPSKQYILVRVIPSCFRFAKVPLCQASLLSRCSPRYLTSSYCGSFTLFVWTGGHVSSHVVNVMWIELDPLSLILRF
jgi:hypothetical protein